jgi:transaldolase
MDIFLDSADVSEVQQLAEWGMCDGVTTNPSLIARQGRDFVEVIRQIASLVDGPISAEVLATEASTMLKEAAVLGEIHPNVVIKLPLTPDGLKACRILSGQGVRTNVTLCFQVSQALLAAKAGATYISPFVGRIDDISGDGMALVSEICEMYRRYGFQTRVLAASIRHPRHVSLAAAAGAHAITAPFKVIMSLYQHPLTDRGLDSFLADWTAAGMKPVV